MKPFLFYLLLPAFSFLYSATPIINDNDVTLTAIVTSSNTPITTENETRAKEFTFTVNNNNVTTNNFEIYKYRLNSDVFSAEFNLSVNPTFNVSNLGSTNKYMTTTTNAVPTLAVSDLAGVNVDDLRYGSRIEVLAKDINNTWALLPKVFNIYIDESKPSFTQTINTTTNDGNVTLDIIAGVSDVKSFQYKVDNGNYSAPINFAIATMTQKIAIGLSGGTHTVTTKVIDRNGLESDEQETSFAIDTNTNTFYDVTIGIKSNQSSSTSNLPIFGYDTVICANCIVNFDVNSSKTTTSFSPASTNVSTDQNATAWEWDFGDGSTKSTTGNPTHIYTKVGTYTVTVVVKYEEAGTGKIYYATDTKIVNIENCSTCTQVAPTPVTPVYVAPAPVYVAPAPVYVAPAPVYVAPAPVYVAPAPVYVAPAPVYVAPAPVYVAPAPVYVAPAPVVIADKIKISATSVNCSACSSNGTAIQTLNTNYGNVAVKRLDSTTITTSDNLISYDDKEADLSVNNLGESSITQAASNKKTSVIYKFANLCHTYLPDNTIFTQTDYILNGNQKIKFYSKTLGNGEVDMRLDKYDSSNNLVSSKKFPRVPLGSTVVIDKLSDGTITVSIKTKLPNNSITL